MLQVDYEVKTRQGRDESIHTPNPKICDIPGNIMIIEGPNSSGKSTLMNLIAIGSYGEMDESLSASMRSNLQELTKSSYRDISFDINIQDPKTGRELQFVRKSGSKENIVLENGVQLNEQQFRQRYNLIYDIPENPTARLKSITKAIKDDHRSMLARVSDYNDYVGSVWKRIDGKLTESDVVRIEKDISETKKELEQINTKGDDTKLHRLEMLLTIRNYLDTRELMDKIQQKIDFEMKKPTMSGAMREMESNAGKLEKQIQSIQPKSIGAVSNSDNPIVRDYLNLISMWNEIRGCSTSELDSKLNQFQRVVFDLKEKVPDVSEEAKALDIVDNAMEALRKIGAQEKIGEIGCISDILEALSEYRSTLADQSTISQYRAIKAELNRISNMIMSVCRNVHRLSSVQIPVNSANYRDEDEISRLNNQKGVEGNKLLGYQSKMVEQGIDVSKAIPTLQEICCSLGVGYTVRSDEIKSMILKQESEEKTTKDRVRRLEKYINDQQDKVERYRNEEKDPFLNDRDRISKIMNAIRSVRTKINTMDQRLDTIDQGDKSIYDRDPEFYTPIWEYIGHRLGSVRDKGKEYSVRSVNLFAESKGLIIAEDGTEIHIGAMGTGEGQLSYIRGLLSNEDERMMIVLLDEVGNMSNSTIDFVKERLKCLQAEGKLMIGMMVRPGDVMEVTTFGL